MVAQAAEGQAAVQHIVCAEGPLKQIFGPPLVSTAVAGQRFVAPPAIDNIFPALKLDIVILPKFNFPFKFTFFMILIFKFILTYSIEAFRFALRILKSKLHRDQCFHTTIQAIFSTVLK